MTANPTDALNEAAFKTACRHYSEGGCVGFSEYEREEVVADIIFAYFAALPEAQEPTGQDALVAERDEAFNQGVDAAIKAVDARQQTYHDEHGNYDHTTGIWEYPGTGDEYMGELDEIKEALAQIRQITGDPSVDAAALIAELREKAGDIKGAGSEHNAKLFERAAAALASPAQVGDPIRGHADILARAKGIARAGWDGRDPDEDEETVLGGAVELAVEFALAAAQVGEAEPMFQYVEIDGTALLLRHNGEEHRELLAEEPEAASELTPLYATPPASEDVVRALEPFSEMSDALAIVADVPDTQTASISIHIKRGETAEIGPFTLGDIRHLALRAQKPLTQEGDA